MTPAGFRKLALALPETEERSHMDHPDFRVAGKIFATLNHDETLGMVSLTPEQQADFAADYPKMFTPVPGGWGRKGATHVKLRAASVAAVKQALYAAWTNKAPKL